MRVSCALVVVVCLCVALRAHVRLSGICIGSCQKKTNSEKHGCHTSVAACRAGKSDRRSCLSTPAVLPARAVTIPCPASAFCSCIRGSVFCTAHVSHLHVLMRLIARVSSSRCYPRTLSFHLLNTVAWRATRVNHILPHPLRGLACLPGHRILHCHQCA